MSKSIKIPLILVYALLLFTIFSVNFEPFDFAFLFSLQSVLYLVFLIFIYSLSISAISFLTVSRGFKNSQIYISVFVLLCFLLAVLTLYKDISNSIATALILVCPFILIFLSSPGLKKTYAITPIYPAIQRAYKFSTLFISLALALSFYFYANINSENPNLSLFIDATIQKTTEVSLNVTGQATKIKIDRQIESLSEKDRVLYEENKEMLDGFFKAYSSQIFDTSKSILTDPVVSQTIEQIKNTTLDILDKYEEQITIVGAFGVFGFAQFVFTLSGIALMPLNLLMFKLFVFAGFFDKIKEKIEVEKYLV